MRLTIKKPVLNVACGLPAAPALALAVVLAVIPAPGCVSDADDARELYRESILEDIAPSLPEGTAPSEAAKRLEEASARLEKAAALTLSDCFKLALTRSEALLIKSEDLLEAESLESEAIGKLLPEVAFIWSYTRDSDTIRFDGEKITPLQSTESWIRVRQPIFDAELFAALDAAGEVSLIERLSLRDERDRLLFAVAAAFYEILALEEDIGALIAGERFAREQVRVLEVRHEAGEAVFEAVEAGRAVLEESLSALAAATNDLALARGRLCRLISLDAIPDELVDNYELDYSPGLIPDLAERAWTTRSDVKAARVSIDLARTESKAALSGFLPTVDATLFRWFKREGAFREEVDWTLNLLAEWPIFDWGARDAAYSRALATVRQRELELASLRHQVRLEVEEAVLAFRSLGATESALARRVAAAAAALRDVQFRLDADEAVDLDLLAARSDHESARRQLERLRLVRKQAALKIRLVVGDFSLSGPVETMLKESG